MIEPRTDVRAAFLGSELNPVLRVPLEFVAGSEGELLAFLRNRYEPDGSWGVFPSGSGVGGDAPGVTLTE